MVNCTNTDCDELRGAVQVDVLWIVNQDGVEDAPYEMSRTARDVRRNPVGKCSESEPMHGWR